MGQLRSLIHIFINLDRSKDRLEWMNTNFPESTRLKAIDGLVYSDGTFDAWGRPNWDPDTLSDLISKRLVHEKAFTSYTLFPTELGCTLSHLKACSYFLSTNCTHAVITEDDIQPTEILKNSDLETELSCYLDNDLTYLFGPGNNKKIQLLANGQVKRVHSHMGYLVSRKGASLFSKAITPIVYQSDWQVGFRIFESMVKRHRKWLPEEFPTLKIIKAYGLDKPLIELSPLAKETTFTSNKKKVWKI